MRIVAGEYPGQPTDVIRLWCVDKFDECAVYAEAYEPGHGPVVGTRIWWNSGKIFFEGDRRNVRKIGYSFDPNKADT